MKELVDIPQKKCFRDLFCTITQDMRGSSLGIFDNQRLEEVLQGVTE